VSLYSQLSDALKFFSVEVTQQEEAAEKELIASGNLERFLGEAFVPDLSESDMKAALETWSAISSRYDSRFKSRFGSRYGQGLTHALKAIRRDSSEVLHKSKEPTPEKGQK